MPQSLEIQPLTRTAFARFGDLVEADPASMRLINGGTTERFHALGHAQALGEGAEVIISLFRGQPRALPYSVDMMERHPLGSQSFVPLSGRPYLVAVAPAGEFDGEAVRLFRAAPHQGVHYRRGVWHHFLLALGGESDFLVVDRAGPGENCEEAGLPPGEQFQVKLQAIHAGTV